MEEKRSKLSGVIKVLLVLLFGVFILILGIVVDECFLDAFTILPWNSDRHSKDKQDDVR